MTRQGAPTPPPPSPADVEYVRKLSLAILSTLQTKGLLSADEVDTILITARRAAQGVPGHTQAGQSGQSQAQAGQGQLDPGSSGLPRDIMQVMVQPSPPPSSFTWRVGTPPANPDTTPKAQESREPDKAEASAEEQARPLFIDIKLD
ncbi:hypothetical protein DEIPH_ctg025orf0198 [Deinococcus phoenicis]|uniref:Uncharacterized protein n=1 Tax=Deinococcus phoenicis TaxID=1476583 RepID=A0A016QRB3_9DEIO|nr:hypothetical protein [Deinococcus phoenicis]EYB68324.1 hypothetical protein DEIPH_ctg025orf0198 [Deinococcus phoenicis]